MDDDLSRPATWSADLGLVINKITVFDDYNVDSVKGGICTPRLIR